MESAIRRARSGNLTALLVAVSVLEFIVNRLAGRLFFPRSAVSSGGWQTTHVVNAARPFLFQLTAFLGLAVMVAAFAGLFRRGELYPRTLRLSTAFIALCFSVLCASAVVSGGIRAQWFVITQICYAFLALLTGVAFLAGNAPVRLK